MRLNWYNHIHLGRDRSVSPALLTALIDAAVFASSGVAAFLLRFEFAIETRFFSHMLWGVVTWVVIKSFVFHKARLNQICPSHASLPDVIGICVANSVGSLASAVVLLLLAPHGFPRSVYLIDFLISVLGTVGVRAVARLIHDGNRHGADRQQTKRAFIYGAGDAGVILLREMRSNPGMGYDICGLIDDNPRKVGMLVHRIPILGQGCELPTLARAHSVQEVIITIPSARGPEMARILEYCHNAGVRCKTMPSVSEWIEGAAAASQIRDVAVEDLLGRNPVHLDQDGIREKLQDQVVMVTGAAGSIGSELCRQIARFKPRALVAFEIAETAAFHLEHEMQSKFPEVAFYPELGSIQNLARIREVMQTYAPSVVYHAAAYKHVPLMEKHVSEAVENNVFGTWNVATAAAEFGVEDFVMISSDKAVHPTSIMGATKRVAEMLIHSLRDSNTKFVSVRFGNVLGSNGSVVPLFKKQIAHGGPVTVTDPDMQRYFMTIPEAAQLVLQASTLGHDNEIFVLDMGEPVKIVDLAHNLILLSGLRPDQDIKIQFTGIRPGEKLYEETNHLNEDTKDTHHDKIKIFMGNRVPHDFSGRLHELRSLCESRDVGGLVLTLKEIVPDYNPGSHMLRNLLTRVQPYKVAVAAGDFGGDLMRDLETRNGDRIAR